MLVVGDIAISVAVAVVFVAVVVVVVVVVGVCVQLSAWQSVKKSVGSRRK